MTHGPQPDSTSQGPDTPPTGESARQDPGAAARQTVGPVPSQIGPQPYQFPQQGPVPPQQPWGAPGFPGAPRPAGPATGPGLAVVALVLGVIGCVVWLLPIDESGVRHYLPLPFALGGLVLGIMGLVGNRRGKPVAAVGVILSAIALVLAILMVGLEVVHNVG